ncbi:hypothetical protein TNCV_1307001 [Trichonephila clavipes]|nr:hypothetical protein TNCV_1307001 [Trichonephila clavipes]
MVLNLDTNIDDGMEQSLPSSATTSRHSSRPGTPMESTCKRLQDLNHIAKVYSEGVTTTKRTIEGYRRNGHEDDNPLIIDPLRQLAAYEEYVQRALSELSSLPPCDIPGCTDHNTPTCSPTKPNLQDSPLPKNTATKRTENKDGVSPRLPHVN